MTQMVGCCREEETAFFRHWLAQQQRDSVNVVFRDRGGGIREEGITNDAVEALTRVVDVFSSTVGFACMALTAAAALHHVVHLIPDADFARLQSFALRAVDALPSMWRATDAMRGVLSFFTGPEEASFVYEVSVVLSSRRPPTSTRFIELLRSKWTAPAFHAMLCARGHLPIGGQLVAGAQLVTRHKAAREADVAAHGLKRCGLPSCDKREATVHHFKHCSACRQERYCFPEHAALHWKEHKPTCRATVAREAAAKEALAREGEIAFNLMLD